MTKEKIDPEVFEKLVDLAAIALDPNQSEYLRSELNKQLTAIEELEAIQLDSSVPLALHGIKLEAEFKPPLREDVPQIFGNSSDILGQAPEVKDGYIVVPDIPHKDLD